MLKRILSAILIVALTPQLTSCSVKRRQQIEPPAEDWTREEITGVTTVEGEVVNFDDPRARGMYRSRLENDTIYAVVRGEDYKIPLDQVIYVWIQRTDSAASAIATIGLVLGVTAGLLLITFAIVAATKESCPFIYSWDGAQYVFDAEPYGGAITRGLERDDYSELEHLAAEDGFYRLMITNEVHETQYTNLVELWVVDHLEGIKVVADSWGNLHTVSEPVSLESAWDNTGRDLTHWLSATDRIIWEPEAMPDASGTLRQDIVMTFPRPADAKSGKLLANVATGLWGSYMIREFSELRGRDLESWYALVDASPLAAQAVREWSIREELYQLKVWVERPTGWEQQGMLLGGGPFIAEHRALPLDLSQIEGDRLRIRIQPPRGFWALNSFAVDYSASDLLKVDTVAPIAAVDEGGLDVLADLLADDDRYYVMPRTGDRGYLTFAAPALKQGMTRSIFLHSRGYYLLHLEAERDPDVATLATVESVPGAAIEFAAERYIQWRARYKR